MKLKVESAPVCSHCGSTMIRYDLPPVSFSDGLGWPTTFLWMCYSDECPIFRRGFEHTVYNYGQTSTMRAIVEPDSGAEACIPACTLDMDHFKTFVEIRKEAIKDARESDDVVEKQDDDDDFYSDEPFDPYDPSSKGGM